MLNQKLIAQIKINNQLNWLLQNKDNCLELPFYSVDILFDSVLEFYNLLSVSFPQNNHVLKNSQSFKALKKDSFNNCIHLNKIKKIVKENSDLFKHFILQGSYGDLSYLLDWSDVDIIAVIKIDSLKKENRKRLIKVVNLIHSLMFEIDPYQHHGIQFLCDIELEFYPNLYYPPNLFSDAICLIDSKSIFYSLENTEELEQQRFKSIVELLIVSGKTGELRHHEKNGVCLIEDFKNKNTMYQMKYFLSLIMLLPTLWINQSGIYCRKKDSFKMLEDFFDKEQIEIVEKSSTIRTTWKRLGQDEINNNTIPDSLIKILDKNYLKRGGKFAELLKRNDYRRLQ